MEPHQADALERLTRRVDELSQVWLPCDQTLECAVCGWIHWPAADGKIPPHSDDCPIGYMQNKAEKAEAELETLRLAAAECLRLADSLNRFAEGGAGFHPHWGSRVMQAVRPLRDVGKFESGVHAHNQTLLEHSGKLTEEKLVLTEQVQKLEAEVASLKAKDQEWYLAARKAMTGTQLWPNDYTPEKYPEGCKEMTPDDHDLYELYRGRGWTDVPEPVTKIVMDARDYYANLVRRLEGLVRHCRVHSAYPDCGFAQMSSEEKDLYQSVIRKGAE